MIYMLVGIRKMQTFPDKAASFESHGFKCVAKGGVLWNKSFCSFNRTPVTYYLFCLAHL